MRWGRHSDLYDSRKIDAAALEAAARERRLSLKAPDVERPDAAGVDATRLVVSRPDQDVAGRGDRVPDDSAASIDRVRSTGH